MLIGRTETASFQARTAAPSLQIPDAIIRAVGEPIDLAIGLGGALVVFAFIAWRMRRERAAHDAWLGRAQRTTGTVERFSVSESTESLTEYTPVIVYEVKGHKYQIGGESSTEQQPPVGSEIDVAYDPALPSSARVVGRNPPTGWGRAMDFGCLVLLTLILTFVVGLVRRG